MDLLRLYSTDDPFLCLYVGPFLVVIIFGRLFVTVFVLMGGPCLYGGPCLCGGLCRYSSALTPINFFSIVVFDATVNAKGLFLCLHL